MSGSSMQKWVKVSLVLWLFQNIYSDCLIPELKIPNGEVLIYRPPEEQNNTSAREMSIIHFKCFDGYIKIGEHYSQCVGSNWTDIVLPFCSGQVCSNPPEIEYATYVTKSFMDALWIGSIAEYKCNEGYEIENINASTLRCVMDMKSRMAVWQREMPVCKKVIHCPDPGVSKHGSWKGHCCKLGEDLQFECNSGYELIGEKEIHCLKTGVWSSHRPLCRPLEEYCQPPSKIPHGVVTGKKSGDYFVPGELAVVVCEPGYRVNGYSFSECWKGGVWRRNFGTCEEIFCNAPESIENGSILELESSNRTTFPYNFEINYACEKGFRLFGGASWRTCGPRGWSGKGPRCEVLRCPDPGTPDNGIKIGNDYSVGAIVRFDCSHEYELLGSNERRCTTNGQWSGEISRCNIRTNYCPDPGTPIHGFKDGSEYMLGDLVHFRCNSTYTLVGSDVRECLPGGIWSGKETKCLDYYDFDDEVRVSNILMAKLEKIAFQRSVIYFAFDASGTAGFLEKSIEFAKAVVGTVYILEQGVRAGALTFNSQDSTLFWPMSMSTTEQVLDALDRINITGGSTTLSSMLREMRMNHIPIIKEWIATDEVKPILFILTQGNKNMGEHLIYEADLLKADGVEIFSIGIIGNRYQNLLFDVVSSSKHGKIPHVRPNAFILQNQKSLALLAQGIANGSIYSIFKDYSHCGLGAESVGVNRKLVDGDEGSRWPWMAALYMTTGNEDPEVWKFQCAGTILDPWVILTSAACMYNDQKRRGTREILVKLGLTDLRNQTFLKEYEVHNIFVHDKFNPGNYDYDIAMLELKDPIEYNPYIRPICLPTKDDDDLFQPHYLPHSIVLATGWGMTEPNDKVDYTQRSRISQSLREVRLPIQTRETCRNSLMDEGIDDSFTARMFCAGDGLGGEDTCSGDRGGPVMQPIVNQDGETIWIQVGIVSWGLGCRMEGEYGFYTHVQELMPWIADPTEEDIETN